MAVALLLCLHLGYAVSIANLFSALAFHTDRHLVMPSTRHFWDDTLFFSSNTAGAVYQLAGPVEKAQVILKVVGVVVALLCRVLA